MNDEGGGLFESLVIFFGLTSISTFFQNFINITLLVFSYKYIITYPVDILIYSNYWEKYRTNVWNILSTLSKTDLLYPKLEKYKLDKK